MSHGMWNKVFCAKRAAQRGFLKTAISNNTKERGIITTSTKKLRQLEI
jgi:hypothetical protein